ncbi:hypothetical protein FWK35_00014091, partial [Aphis craccivora]
MKNLVLNFQLLAFYTNIFMNCTYKIIFQKKIENFSCL